jgi:hypothetical protein
MRNILKLVILAIALWSFPITPALAQDAVPAEILARTIFIKVGTEAGTAFTIDYQGTLYLVV